MAQFSRAIRPHVDAELAAAQRAYASGNRTGSFKHLERAHVLGQASTAQHVRVHGRMLIWALRERDLRETLGQLLRIVGAATKTAFGLIPHGNTGGANVSPVRPLPIPEDLRQIIESAKRPDH